MGCASEPVASAARAPSSTPPTATTSTPGGRAAAAASPAVASGERVDPVEGWFRFAVPTPSSPEGDAPERPGDARSTTNVSALFAGKSIVLLGESLHITTEFPRARLPLVRELHDTKGFDLVAFEGSMLDAWLAQDDLRREPVDERSIERAARSGWLTIWNTAPMREVLAAMQQGEPGRRIYFASMDIQPAMGGTPEKQDVIERFVRRIAEYAKVKNPREARAIATELEPLRTCRGEQPPPPSRLRAVARLSAWIARADEPVRAAWPMHADALKLVPRMLEQRLRHCEEALGPTKKYDASTYWVSYKEARDRYQAENVLALRDHVSRSHRVIVWGHHTHVAYGAAGARARVSIAGVLRERAPEATYVVGLFAGAGRFTRLEDGPKDALVPTAVPRAGDPCCSGLDALRALGTSAGEQTAYFLDLTRRSRDPRLAFAFEPRGYPLEGAATRIVLADEFDGILFLPHVTEARVDFGTDANAGTAADE